MADVSTIEDACQLLRLILQLYKETGPESIESLTRSYLSSPPTSDSVKNVADGLMADASKVFDDATDSVLRAFAAGLGFDLSGSATYQQRRDEGYFRTFYPVLVTYMIWLDQEGEEKVLENLRDIFCSTIFGVAGLVWPDWFVSYTCFSHYSRRYHGIYVVNYRFYHVICRSHFVYRDYE